MPAVPYSNARIIRADTVYRFGMSSKAHIQGGAEFQKKEDTFHVSVSLAFISGRLSFCYAGLTETKSLTDLL